MLNCFNGMNKYKLSSIITHSKCLKICFLVTFTLVLSAVYFQNYLPKNLTFFRRPRNVSFNFLNTSGIKSFYHVCLEEENVYSKFTSDRIGYNETRRIVVYNSLEDKVDQVIIASHRNAIINYWDVTFRRGPIPATHTLINSTAFFGITTCIGNFHHFWLDLFEPMLNVVSMAGRLQPHAENSVFYRFDITKAKGYIDSCHNRDRYKRFMSSLFLENDPVPFIQAPSNICYSTAVFGGKFYTNDPLFAINHTKTYFNEYFPHYSKRNCSVILLNRETRKILNIDEMKKTAEEVGFKNVCVFTFEHLKIEEQVHWLTRARVLIGVQGSGLQWAMFMPKNSFLVEIAWPEKGWMFYYGPVVRPYSIKYESLSGHETFVNWTSYENEVLGGQKLTDEEKKRRLNGPGSYSVSDNLWKWADVKVNITALELVLSSILDFK